MIEVLKFKNKLYPSFQSKGFASKYSFPFANEVCVGTGYDIGCMKKEWAFPGAIPIDLAFDNGYHATNLPDGEVDYIFSSHCLEHITDWVGVLDYWGIKIKKGGVIFLYLPDYSQEYWRPWNNRKHINILTPEYLKNYFEDKNFEKVFVSGVDLNNSFIVMVEK
jgi:predicted SAM-dependent methyltransferase